MKSFRKLFGIAVLCSMSLLFTACPSEPEPEPTPIPDSPTPVENTDREDIVNIEKIVKDNVSASAEYKYFAFVVDLFTYLTDKGKYFEGRSDIKYGIEWYYSYSPNNSFFYYLDPTKSDMVTTMVSVNHYNVLVPIFSEIVDEEKWAVLNFFSLQYCSLKMKEQKESLSKDEKEALKNDEKLLSPYTSVADTYRRKGLCRNRWKKILCSYFSEITCNRGREWIID